VTYRRKDAYYRRAKSAGYRARSAYKLAELDDRFRLLRRGDWVVDLGAWPGGWMQVALDRVGADGRVVGVDLVPVTALGAPNTSVVAGDLRDPATVEAVARAAGRPVDVLLSDLAPKLTGIAATDEARCAELVAATLAALPVLLRPGGRLLMKAFMDAGHQELLGRLRASFDDVKTTRPDATRRGSAELYLVGVGYRRPARTTPSCG
jgi:23S rRNA (uridine2552-2'-O)-methyltransferase